MMKVASIILLSILSITLGEDEIELNEKGCPIDTRIYKILPHENCNQFYKCSNGEPIPFKCPENLAFNLDESVCDWPNHVDCGSRLIPTTEAPTTESPTTQPIEETNDAASICARGESDGQLVAHEYCNHVYMCVHGVPIDIECPGPLLFDTENKVCDWESQVDCGDRLREKENKSEEK